MTQVFDGANITDGSTWDADQRPDAMPIPPPPDCGSLSRLSIDILNPADEVGSVAVEIDPVPIPPPDPCIDLDNTCYYCVDDGSTVTLTPTAEGGAEFTGWNQCQPECSNSEDSCSFTMPSATVMCLANFAFPL